MWAVYFSSTTGPLQNSRNQDSPFIPVSTSVNVTMGPLKVTNGNMGRSWLPDKEKLFPELSSSRPIPNGWPFGAHNSSSFPFFLVLRGTWGGHALCWDAEREESLTLSQEYESVGYGWSWLFGHCVVVCILAHARTLMEVSFFMIEKVRWRGRTLFRIRRPSLSIRVSSLTSFSLLWAPIVQTFLHTFLSQKNSALS